MQECDDLKKVRRAALAYLARRDYSRFNLFEKLKTKGFSASEAETVVDDLVRTGLVNDKLFAENYVYHRRNKGYGPKRIHIELEMHGIATSIIAEVLNIADNAWLIEAKRLWGKRFKNISPSDLKTRAKQIHFLQYRGFTSEQIKHVIPK